MRISVATYGPDPMDRVPEKLADAKYLHIMETDDMSTVDCVKGGAQPDVDFAHITNKTGCEAIICGQIDEMAFNILAGAQTTRYDGNGCTVPEALEKMLDDVLPIIPDFIGGMGCDSHHDESNCHHHDFEDEEEE